MAVAGLSEGVITPESTVNCKGGATFYGRYFQCHKKGGHGVVDLRHAIEQSCNVFFYTVGEKLKIDTIHKYARFLGLVGRTGIDLPGENESLVPSEEWKKRTQNQPWYPGETISVAIGQGAVDVTPISLATMIATVANGGTLVTPHVLRAVDEDGKGWKPAATPSPRSALLIRPDHLQAIRDGLWLAVNGPQGTAQRLRMEGRDVAGKTGTAQVISLEGRRAATGRTTMDLRDNGWLVFFAPRDNPQIAGVVFGEHSEHGYLDRTHRQARPRHVLREARRASRACADTSRCPGEACGDRAMIVERRLSAHIDWPLIGAVLALTVIGLATIYSVTWDFRNNQPGARFWAQVYALPVGLTALVVCLAIDYRTLTQRSLLIYVGLLAALVYVMVLRRGAHGRAPVDCARRVHAAAVGVRPDHAGARARDVLRREPARARAPSPNWPIGAVLLAMPALLIFKQPDLGTAATLVPVFLGVDLSWPACGSSGSPWRRSCSSWLSPVVWRYGLEDYQSKRVSTFLDPSQDPARRRPPADSGQGHRGVGRAVRQGLQAGHSGRLRVPAGRPQRLRLFRARRGAGVSRRARDARPVSCSCCVRSLDAAKLAKDRVGAFLVVAIISGFGFQVVYNITMSAGLAPVKGLTLPLMSYGGSSLVATLAGFGLILNVRMRRFTN